MHMIRSTFSALCLTLLLAPAHNALAEPKKSEPQTIDITTREYTIEGPEKLDLGWHRFRFRNLGGQAHFVAFYKLVEGKTIEDQLREVVPVFDPLMEGLRSGELTKADIGPFIQEHMPAWGMQMTWAGGPGLMAPGKTSYATIELKEPGIYLMECYVKAPDGQWHTAMGMLQQVEVTDNQGGIAEPTAGSQVSVRNTGIEAPAKIPAGRQTIRVNFLENPPGPFPYDLHLARLQSDTDIDKVAYWMDWSNVGGLRAPAPVEFVGGMEQLPAGNHGYVTVDLEPGRYLWISKSNASEMNATFLVE
ncbi:DUF1579 domain-containing protein [Microbulbifer guangxiensis]|uniref:DUF1579 domain-containing protein n=1 Tax=Microbulbifer guangxiensis TaxID=2904249 RepID=UPI001F32431C|nr:DUF1579 domain-containing protein [Microbulbifer guangxiensis]